MAIQVKNISRSQKEPVEPQINKFKKKNGKPIFQK